MFSHRLSGVAKTSRVITGTLADAKRIYLRNPKITAAFELRFTPKHTFTYTTSVCITSGPTNPLFEYHIKLLEARSAPLWQSFVCTRDAGRKKVVKTSLQKKVRAAFWQALARNGYTKDGEISQPQIAGSSQEPLVGTVQFIIGKECMKISGSQLEKQMDEMVGSIIPRQIRKNPRQRAPFSIHR